MRLKKTHFCCEVKYDKERQYKEQIHYHVPTQIRWQSLRIRNNPKRRYNYSFPKKYLTAL